MFSVGEVHTVRCDARTKKRAMEELSWRFSRLGVKIVKGELLGSAPVKETRDLSELRQQRRDCRRKQP